MGNVALRVRLITSGVETLTRLSVLAGIERTRLSRTSNGLIVLRPEERQSVAQALDCTVAELFDDEVPACRA